MIKTKCTSIIYATPHCSAKQIDSRNSFLLSFFCHEIELKPCSLISFRNKLQKVNLAELLCSENTIDLEIIRFGCIDRVFVFSLHEIIELKTLLEGIFTMLELNSLIHSRLVRL